MITTTDLKRIHSEDIPHIDYERDDYEVYEVWFLDGEEISWSPWERKDTLYLNEDGQTLLDLYECADMPSVRAQASRLRKARG